MSQLPAKNLLGLPWRVAFALCAEMTIEEQPDLLAGLPPAQSPLKHTTKKAGYAAPPGTGPSGELCRTCANARRFRNWAKCELMRPAWTGGLKTDILLNTPACSKFAKKP